MKWVYRFIVWLVPLKQEAAEFQALEWTEWDSQNLALFMNGTTGKKLNIMLNNTVAQQNADACAPAVKDRSHAMGVAYGFQLARAWILNNAKLTAEVPNASKLILDDQTPSDAEIEEAMSDASANYRGEAVLG